jgi:hypothetical protein
VKFDLVVPSFQYIVRKEHLLDKIQYHHNEANKSERYFQDAVFLAEQNLFASHSTN